MCLFFSFLYMKMHVYTCECTHVCVRAFGCLFVHEKETHRDVSKFLVCSRQIECDQSVHLRAKCTVLVIQHHCGQTFGTHLGGWERRSPVKSRCRRGAAPRIFFDFFFGRGSTSPDHFQHTSSSNGKDPKIHSAEFCQI